MKKAKEDGFFRPYRGAAQIDAFIDYQAELEQADGPVRPSEQLLEFRVILRRWIRMGWEKMTTGFEYQNLVGCYDHLPEPRLQENGLIEHDLPINRCGTPSNCGLNLFVDGRRAKLLGLAAHLDKLSTAELDSETKKRIESLRRISEISTGGGFKKRDCYKCGDALICFEALGDKTVVTKNGKHFNPIANYLGIATRIAQNSISTRPPEEPAQPAQLPLHES
ncbi:MAG: hypothetical protein JNL10_09965 [Verrucomicrobiales bacterium]|nr:hypothetical protein [Verrucomicrobiales bacterium]